MKEESTIWGPTIVNSKLYQEYKERKKEKEYREHISIGLHTRDIIKPNWELIKEIFENDRIPLNPDGSELVVIISSILLPSFSKTANALEVPNKKQFYIEEAERIKNLIYESIPVKESEEIVTVRNRAVNAFRRNISNKVKSVIIR